MLFFYFIPDTRRENRQKQPEIKNDLKQANLFIKTAKFKNKQQKPRDKKV
jgi:hypothetical protein